jgi:hypothetical protein
MTLFALLDKWGPFILSGFKDKNDHHPPPILLDLPILFRGPLFDDSQPLDIFQISAGTLKAHFDGIIEIDGLSGNDLCNPGRPLHI